MSPLMLLAEGFEAAQLPCTLILLVPGIALGLAARELAIPAVAAFWLSVLAFGWLRFSGRGAGWHFAVAAVALLIGVMLIVYPPIARLDLVAIAAGLLTGLGAAELWLPCVGPELGTLLGELPQRATSGIVLLAAFLAGALSPLIILAAIHHLLPDWLLERVEPIWSVVGAVLLGTLAVATGFGFHETLVGWLFQWSIQ